MTERRSACVECRLLWADLVWFLLCVIFYCLSVLCPALKGVDHKLFLKDQGGPDQYTSLWYQKGKYWWLRLPVSCDKHNGLQNTARVAPELDVSRVYYSEDKNWGMFLLLDYIPYWCCLLVPRVDRSWLRHQGPEDFFRYFCWLMASSGGKTKEPLHLVLG